MILQHKTFSVNTNLVFRPIIWYNNYVRVKMQDCKRKGGIFTRDAIKNILKNLVHIFFSKKFAEFCVLGTFNTFNAAWISSLFSLFLQPNLAACIGYLFSLTIAYYLSCRIIFESIPSKTGYTKFLLSYIPSFIIYFLITFITINTLQLQQFWATVLAAVTGGPTTFIIMKFFTFNNKNNNHRHH